MSETGKEEASRPRGDSALCSKADANTETKEGSGDGRVLSDISQESENSTSDNIRLSDSSREAESPFSDDKEMGDVNAAETGKQRLNEGSDDSNRYTEDDAEFAILDSEYILMEELEGDIIEAEDKEPSDEDNEFAIVDKESSEASPDDTDRDGSGSDHSDGDHKHVTVQRPVDLFVNSASAQQRKAFFRQKAKRIENILNEDPVDLSELRQQAISRGGLLNAHLRQRAWPRLLNVNVDNIAPKPDYEILKNHRDYCQVTLDVNRSIKRFPPGMDEVYRLSLQDKLVDVIMRVLVRHPELHYYQLFEEGLTRGITASNKGELLELPKIESLGFHDICVTFLLVVDEDLAFALVERLCQSHLRDFMEPTMERTQQLLDYVPPLLRRANPELLQYLEGAELGSVFCVSWLLTWFGHVLNDIASILRIYDFFIACHPLMPVYVMGAVVLYREKEIFNTEQDMAALYQLLIRVPDNLPFEHLLSNAGDLFLQYPPTELANEAIRRFKRAQAQAAERKARGMARQQAPRKSSLLPDGNVTFSQVTFWMLGAVVSVAAYALMTGMEWSWSSWTSQ